MDGQDQGTGLANALLFEKIIHDTHAPSPGGISDREYVVRRIQCHKSCALYSRGKLLPLCIRDTHIVPAVHDQCRSADLRQNCSNVDIAMSPKDLGGNATTTTAHPGLSSVSARSWRRRISSVSRAGMPIAACCRMEAGSPSLLPRQLESVRCGRHAGPERLLADRSGAD